MRTKEELTFLISECEEKIKKMKNDLDSYYAALEPQVAPLIKASDEMEAHKKEVKKKSAPTFLWVITAILVIGAIVCNVIEIAVLTGTLLVAAIAVGGYAFVIKSKYDKEYNAQILQIGKEQDDIDAQVEEIYATDPRIEATEKDIECAEKELVKLNAEYSDIKVFDEIGTDNLVIYCSYAAVGDKCFVIVDGVERGIMKESIAMYYLDPGEHTFFINVVRPEKIIDMDDIDFSVNGTNKYVFIDHDYRTYEYETKVYDSFDAFAENFKDTKWVKEKLLKCAKNN